MSLCGKDGSEILACDEGREGKVQNIQVAERIKKHQNCPYEDCSSVLGAVWHNGTHDQAAYPKAQDRWKRAVSILVPKFGFNRGSSLVLNILARGAMRWATPSASIPPALSWAIVRAWKQNDNNNLMW